MKFRRCMVIILTLAMIVALIPSTQALSSGKFLTTDNKFYLVGASMNVSVTGLTDAQINDQNAYVGIYLAGDKPDINAYNGNYKYISDLSDGKTWSTTVPSDFGNYEVRLYWLENGKDTLVESIPFTVGSKPANTGDLTISKNQFLVNEQAIVTISGLTEGQIGDGAWAGIFREGDDLKAPSYSGMYVYIRDLRDGKTWQFGVPNEFGRYEIRVFTKDVPEDKREAALFGKLSFAVGSITAKPGDLKISKDRFLVNEPATVTLTGLTKEQIADGAWAGIFKQDDAFKTDSYNGMYVYVRDLRDGKTWEVNVPNEFGKYEIRVFTKDVPEDQREAALFGKLPFVVGSNPAKPGDLKISKQNFKMQETITVIITGLTTGQIDNGAWAGVFKQDDAFKTDSYNGIYESIKDLRDGKTWTFKASTDPGIYEVRVFTQNVDPEERELAFFGRLPFTVENATLATNNNGAFDWGKYKLNVISSKMVNLKVKQKIKNVTSYKVINLKPNMTDKLKATANLSGLAPIPVNNLVAFRSYDSKIAKVDKYGTLKGVTKGTTYITVKGGNQTIIIIVNVRK